ncbi:unnamed protein product [Chrysoparadoxa australica]
MGTGGGVQLGGLTLSFALVLAMYLRGGAGLTPKSMFSRSSAIQKGGVNNSKAMAALRRVVPPMVKEMHKGQQGRVGVLGGSPDYTGAPYFSGISALRAGSDLVYVLTASEAAAAIKSYSPELMVTPVYSTGQPGMLEAVSAVMPKLHALVVGPGLGRDSEVFKSVRDVILMARERELPLVLDADALMLCALYPDTIKGYKLATLTPNIMEFARLWSAVGFGDWEAGADATEDEVERLAARLGNVTVVLKGGTDVISDGKHTLTCDIIGGLKRCGGLGDVLSGVLGTVSAWVRAEEEELEGIPIRLWGLWWGCAFVRLSTSAAYNGKGRSMGAPDAIAELGSVIEQLVPANEWC